MVAGSKRRSVKDSLTGNLDYIVKKCEAAHDPRQAALLALIYASGRRIGELIPLKRKHFKVTEKRVTFTTFNEKVYRSQPIGQYRIRRDIISVKAIRDPETKKIIYPKKYEKTPVTIYNEEIHPDFTLDSETGKALARFIIPYLEKKSPEDYVFHKLKGQGHMSYVLAYVLIRQLAPEIWPHLIRHWRFTQLADIYEKNPIAMHRRTFHKRFESTLGYIREKEDVERERRS